MNKETIESIKRIVGYLEGEEKRHYLESGRAERKNHIYNDIRKVKEYLNK